MNVMLGREVLVIAMHLCSEVREGRWKDKEQQPMTVILG
jgi:hypothetical protein